MPLHIPVQYKNESESIKVNGDSFQVFTGLSYDEVATVFPPVSDDDEDRSENTLEDC